MGRRPVTSLLRFKPACKSWRDRQTTTTTTSSSNKFGSFIVQTTEPSDSKYEDDIKMYMLSSGSGNGNDGSEDDGDDGQKKMVVVDDLGFLQFYQDFLLEEELRMVGSCNGIICLHDPWAMDQGERGGTRQHYSHLRDVSLWNPATRQFRILPKSIPIEERREDEKQDDLVTFGFDVKTKDYRVLRITPFNSKSDMGDEGCMCRVQVYSLSTDSWRLLEGIHYLPVGLIPELPGIYLNGSYFFVGRNLMLLSFDFTEEIFTTMQLPPGGCTVLSCVGDKLAVFTKPEIDYPKAGYEYYDIWVLNEQHDSAVADNKESWTKFHSFRIKTRTREWKLDFDRRCISNNGEFALISNITDDGHGRNKLQLFNLVTTEAKKDITIGSTSTTVCRVDVYKESQVSIMGENVLLRWQLPTDGTCYKLNLDAPFIDSYRPFGIGLCLTSDTGGCIGVRSLRSQVRDAKEGEALAMFEAIKWAKKLKLSPIIIESDSKNCVSFFMDDNNNSTYWSSGELSLLWEAKFLLKSSKIGISFQYRSRSCNYVADIAAKLGREGLWLCKDWTANFPGEIVMSLSKDLGLETRDLEES